MADAHLSTVETEYTPPPTQSPWGKVTNYEAVAAGIWIVEARNYYGWSLSPARNAKVHPAWRQSDGFYHQDDQWRVAAWTFIDEVEGTSWVDAPGGIYDRHTIRQQLRDNAPDQWEAVTGEKLTAANSAARFEEELLKKQRTSFIVQTQLARSDGNVTVDVVRAEDGATVRLVVPKGSYNLRRTPLNPDDYFITSMKADGALRLMESIIEDGRQRVDQDAAARLDAAHAAYQDEMKRLNPLSWGNPKHPATKREPGVIKGRGGDFKLSNGI